MLLKAKVCRYGVIAALKQAPETPIRATWELPDRHQDIALLQSTGKIMLPQTCKKMEPLFSRYQMFYFLYSLSTFCLLFWFHRVTKLKFSY